MRNPGFMKVCQNPNCSNPFNPNGNKFCISCGLGDFSSLLRNRFRVQKVIGEGGFGRTYLAEDTDRLDAACVVKPQYQAIMGKNPSYFQILHCLGNGTQLAWLIDINRQQIWVWLGDELPLVCSTADIVPTLGNVPELRVDEVIAMTRRQR